MDWAWQLQRGAEVSLPGKKPYNTDKDLLNEVKSELDKGLALNGGKHPQVLIIGALGRCGRGAVDLCKAAGLSDSQLLKWDLEETKKGGPFKEIKDSDVCDQISSSASHTHIVGFCQLHLSLASFHTKIRDRGIPQGG